ncbi:hypothetical protein CROQUDRAFT_666125 [Cronartium quercuum f. sp. fusiforme G11]|uniref:Uncharacterized protein n=1 Tax=Cronartium quercuum f. sp. fusiforme G11 TaxID=708437 RepID=A0A9P6N5K4_9BASI|nr:hypothetical protein CROQUDRAFT_666125 [Cronartium quercuum f. sp. fusiforme G11]
MSASTCLQQSRPTKSRHLPKNPGKVDRKENQTNASTEPKKIPVDELDSSPSSINHRTLLSRLVRSFIHFFLTPTQFRKEEKRSKIMLKGITTVINLPFLFLYVILSWPLSVITGKHKRFRNVDGRRTVLVAAERYTADRNSKRLDIMDATSKGIHSVDVLTAKESGDDASSDEGQESFSNVADISIWQPGHHEYSFLRNSSRNFTPLKQGSFAESGDYAKSRARKRARSPPVLDIVHERQFQVSGRWISSEASRILPYFLPEPDSAEPTREQRTEMSTPKATCYSPPPSNLSPMTNTGAFTFEGPKLRHMRNKSRSMSALVERPNAAGSLAPISPLIPITRSNTVLKSPTEDSVRLSAKKKRSMLFRTSIAFRKPFQKIKESPETQLIQPRRVDQLSAFTYRLKELIPKRLMQKQKGQRENSTPPVPIFRSSMKNKSQISVYSRNFNQE